MKGRALALEPHITIWYDGVEGYPVSRLDGGPNKAERHGRLRTDTRLFYLDQCTNWGAGGYAWLYSKRVQQAFRR